jgi:hypothetical protein
MQRLDEKPPKIGTNELPALWSDRLPNPQQQAANLIRLIGDNQQTNLDWFKMSLSELVATIGLAIAPGDNNENSEGLYWLGSQLGAEKLYETHLPDETSIAYRLTMPGWERYETLKRTHTQSRTAFMAMKFGEPVLDRVVAECFKPAVEQAGFALRLLTDEQPAGLIDDQLRAAILSARFLIADLSHGSYGAYWEAGFAEGLNLPVIYTCECSTWDDSKTHFDTNHMKTIIWDAADLPRAGKDLTATIRATLRAEAKQTDETA